MHLMTFMEVAKPRWYERTLVLAVQRVFFNAYFLGYLLSPKLAHRVVGYLEEEAPSTSRTTRPARSRTSLRRRSPSTTGGSPPAPRSRTSSSSSTPTRRTTATSTISHRYDVHFQGMDLKDTPAPLDYH
ncbi:hypothetical protein OsI_20294 [Oryza sativa Indica Group]|uniref:Ubiquinol oxidase n=1 Tax=Oryza sativa subsp. indica TaxID=39946 RepID=B8AZ29_ORYSI|nr:hypothetical protein OsI_20294 [Oryza sativa Indica Group]